MLARGKSVRAPIVSRVPEAAVLAREPEREALSLVAEDLARGVLAPVQTKVKAVCDGEKIYFLFTCVEPKYGELKAYAINRDEDCWMDDSVEAFLDSPPGQPAEYAGEMHGLRPFGALFR